MNEIREDAARASGEVLHGRVRPQDQRRRAEMAITQAMIDSQQCERGFKAQQARAALREAEQTRSIYGAEPRRSLSERQAQADLKRHRATQAFTKATQRQHLATLAAPVLGTVQQLAMHTEGGVVTEAQALMVIVPDSASVSAEVTLENKDIGFVSPGQGVTIKLETFTFTRYGTVNATVEKVTQDAVNDEKRGAIFPATLKLNQTHGNLSKPRHSILSPPLPS